jgi:hypothetical protein
LGGTAGLATAGGSGHGTAQGTGGGGAAQYTSQGGWSPGGTTAGTPAGGSALPPFGPAFSWPRGRPRLASRARLGPVVPVQTGRYYRPPLFNDSNGCIGSPF